ncbi:flagellar hook-associated protein FlgL [Guyparkeria sp.]|uniref:flagellar hook-associated protein FlgL n=1 Tax=Guyparkeria sp. TaxID=2035736 RepID=UPI003970E480
MRVSTSMIFQSGLQSLQRQQSGMMEAQTDIATGKKLRTADVDPVAFGQASQLSEQQGRIDQYLRNNERATGKIEAQETRLSASTDILQRVRDIAIQANNGINDDSSRAALSSELEQLRDALAEQANAKDERGEYVFSGTEAGQVPYAGSDWDDQLDPGNPGVKLSVAENQQVTTNRVASDIFTLGDGRSAMKAIDELREAIDADDSTFYGPGQQSIDEALDRVTNAQGDMGADMRTLERLRDDQNAWKLANEEAVSKLRDTDIAEAVTRLNQNYLSLQATQQSMVKTQQLSLFNNI